MSTERAQWYPNLFYGDLNNYVGFKIANLSKDCRNYSHFKPFVYELCTELFEDIPTIASVFERNPIKTKKPFHRKPIYVESGMIDYARNIIDLLNQSSYQYAHGFIPDPTRCSDTTAHRLLQVFCASTTRAFIHDIYEKSDIPTPDDYYHSHFSIMSAIPDLQPSDVFLYGKDLKKEIGACIELNEWESRMTLLFSSKHYSTEQMLEIIKKITDRLSMNLEVNI